MKVTNNKMVSIEYTLTDINGELIDTTDGREPFLYQQGEGSIVPGLEAALEGKSIGDKIKICVPPKQGYGEKDQSKIKPLPRNTFSEIENLKVGMKFGIQGLNGVQGITVVEINETSILVDANHPLAGETLNFDVWIKDIKEGDSEEEKG